MLNSATSDTQKLFFVLHMSFSLRLPNKPDLERYC